MKSKAKITLSGTPVENDLEDLWSQFHFLIPGLLGDRNTFQESYAGRAPGQLERLRRLVKPFILRRLKRDVAKELPPKTEILLHVELSQAERTIYESVLSATQQQITNLLSEGSSVISILEAILRLRQACCHAALVPGMAFEGESSKLQLSL